MPRAFVVGHAEPMSDRSQVLAKLKSTDFRTTVLLDHVPQANGGPSLGRSASERSATITHYSPNRVEVTVDEGEPGYLVLTDMWFPGWTCSVDGQAVPIERANYAFRAVPVSATARQVVFNFNPPSFVWGYRISGMAVIVVAGIFLVAGLRRRLLVSGRDSVYNLSYEHLRQ
jgi:hypothetical protein